MDAYGCVWIPMGVWMRMGVYGYVRKCSACIAWYIWRMSIDIYVHVYIFMFVQVYGWLWVCIGVYGCAWVCMGVWCVWVCMGVHGGVVHEWCVRLFRLGLVQYFGFELRFRSVLRVRVRVSVGVRVRVRVQVSVGVRVRVRVSGSGCPGSGGCSCTLDSAISASRALLSRWTCAVVGGGCDWGQGQG